MTAYAYVEKKCEECGSLGEMKKRQKYCPTCVIEIHRKKQELRRKNER